MGPKKRRGRKAAAAMEEASAGTSENANTAGNGGDIEADAVPVAGNIDQHISASARDVTSDKKLSSAAIILENCLLPSSQLHGSRSYIATPTGASEGSRPPSRPGKRKRVSGTAEELSEGTYTGLLSKSAANTVQFKVRTAAQKDEAQLKPVRPRQKRRKVQPVADPGSEACVTAVTGAEQNPTAESAVLNVTSFETKFDLAKGAQPGDEQTPELTGSDALPGKRKQKGVAKKEKHLNKKRKKADAVDDAGVAKGQDDENGSTWMVSHSSGDEERVILKRQRRVIPPPDPVKSDEVCVASSDLAPVTEGQNLDVHLPPADEPAVPGAESATVVQNNIEVNIVDDDSPPAAAELTSKPTGPAPRTRRVRRPAKTVDVKQSLDSVESNPQSDKVSVIQTRKRVGRKNLQQTAVPADCEQIGQQTTAIPTRTTRSRRNGNNRQILNLESNAATESSPVVDCEESQKSSSADSVCVQEKSSDSSSLQSQNSNEADCESLKDAVNIPEAAGLANSKTATECHEGKDLEADQDCADKAARETETCTSELPRVELPADSKDLVCSAESSTLKICLSLGQISKTDESSTIVSESAEDDGREVGKDEKCIPPSGEETVVLEKAKVDVSGGGNRCENSYDDLQVSGQLLCSDKPCDKKNDAFPLDAASAAGKPKVQAKNGETAEVSCVALKTDSVVTLQNTVANSVTGSDDMSVQDNSNSSATSTAFDGTASSIATTSSLDVGSLSSDRAVDCMPTPPNTLLNNETAVLRSSEAVKSDGNLEKIPLSTEADVVLKAVSVETTDAKVSEAEKKIPTTDVNVQPSSDETKETPSGSCPTTNRRAESSGTEESGYIPLKKRRLRMAETSAEIVQVEKTKNVVSLDVVSPCCETVLSTDAATTASGAKISDRCSVELSTGSLESVDGVPIGSKYVGAHVVADGLPGSVLRATQIGARAFALFVKPQKMWAPPPLDPAEIDKFKELMKVKGFSPSMVVPHGSYLLNCGASNAIHLRMTREALVDDLNRCRALGLTLFNFHPGSFSDPDNADECIGRVAETINYAHTAVPDVVTVIENSCGETNSVGGTFDQLKQIIDKVTDKSRVGICLDTCHAFAAGYDLRSDVGYKKMMEEFDSTIGRRFLKVVHVNDSKDELGSHLDHHVSVGKGKIGLPFFQLLMADKSLENIPLILETPVVGHRQEIELLYSFVARPE